MDARRFDGFSKAWSAGTSRRRVLKAFPAVALGSLFPMAARADGGTELVNQPTSTTGAVGGTTSVAVTPVAGSAAPDAVSTQPETPSGIGAQISPAQVLPARIYAGTCGQLGAEPAFQLIDVGAPGAQGTATPASPDPVGAAGAVPARSSTTIVDAMLEDLTASNYAIDVRIDAADPSTSVVCGDIGGILGGAAPGTELALGLSQANGSGYTGVAWLQDEGEQTIVNLFLAAGLATGGIGSAMTPVTPAPATTAAPDEAAETDDAAETAVDTTSAFAPGALVLTSADVNLRASPSLDAAIIAILGPGVQLEVTGETTDGWVPVVEVSTGRRGFVTDAFVTAES
jgi:hypothetical protein